MMVTTSLALKSDAHRNFIILTTRVALKYYADVSTGETLVLYVFVEDADESKR